jgi:hypothetical protein
LVAVAGLALREHRADSGVQSGKQDGGAAADVIVGDALDIAQPHGQHGLGTVQGLNSEQYAVASFGKSSLPRQPEEGSHSQRPREV